MAPVLAPRPKASAAEAVPELVPRAAEVYLLAMLPHASVGRLGGQKSSTPGAAARQVELIDISPAALSKFRDVRIVYDGKLIPLRACPEVSHGIPVGPLREIFEQCDGVLYWFPVQKQVRAVRPGLTLELQIGVPTVKINDGTEQLELAPYIRHGRTMVPLSFLARTLNLNITFDSKRGQLIISRSDM
ncbi:MAG: copper amine oxidase N-terminal domain-containing protein [Armatimonadetes bacterium]|nr:copper amine oxidase N-terminal domain-containing protein [Armatimonadota bacterium]